MNFTEYQREAMAFRLPSANSEYALLNLAGEVGELLSAEAKLIRDGANLDSHRKNVVKELGDILWCITAIADDYNVALVSVAEANIEKLIGRKANNTIKGSGDDR
jgi:NTP pyrophosphatase (non-canonical NTP hydrolase)